MKRFVTFLTLLVSTAFLTSTVSANDIIRKLMKDSVATFSDAYDLLTYSLKAIPPHLKQKTFNEQNDLQRSEQATIETYLSLRGIQNRENQPITRAEFAKTILKRYDLKTGFFTKLFGTPSLYFDDAVHLGIFTPEERGSDPLTTRELLNAFNRAESISRRR